MATKLIPYNDIPSTQNIDGVLPAQVKEIAFSLNENQGDDVTLKVDIIFLFDSADLAVFGTPNQFKVQMTKGDDIVTITTSGNFSVDLSALNNNVILQVTSINNIGASPTSIFAIPAGGAVFVKSNSAIDIFLKANISTLERTSDEIIGNKSMFVNFYRNVSFENIILDWQDMQALPYNAIPMEKEKIMNSTFKAEVNIADAIVMDLNFNSFHPDADFGFSRDVYYMKLDKNGWIHQDDTEIKFIEDFKDIIKTDYERYRLANGLSINDPYILKFIWKHPIKSAYSVVIYFMEGLRWQL